jgi:hypothetical protein
MSQLLRYSHHLHHLRSHYVPYPQRHHLSLHDRILLKFIRHLLNLRFLMLLLHQWHRLHCLRVSQQQNNQLLLTLLLSYHHVPQLNHQLLSDLRPLLRHLPARLPPPLPLLSRLLLSHLLQLKLSLQPLLLRQRSQHLCSLPPFLPHLHLNHLQYLRHLQLSRIQAEFKQQLSLPNIILRQWSNIAMPALSLLLPHLRQSQCLPHLQLHTQQSTQLSH